MNVGADSTGTYFAARLQKFSRESFTPRMAGFMLSKAWVYVLFLSPVAFYRDGSASSLVSFGALSRDALIVTLLVGGLVLSRWLERAPVAFKCAFPACCSVMGCLALALAGSSDLLEHVLVAVAAALTGVGSGMLALFWGSIYGRASGPVAAAEASLAFCFAAFLVPAYALFPAWAQLLVVALLPLGSAVLLARELKGLRLEVYDEAASAEMLPAKRAKGLLAKIVVSSVVFGLVIMLLRQLYGQVYEQQIESALPASSLVLAASGFVAACIVITLLLLSRRLDLAFSYQPILLLVALGCFLLPMLEHGSALPYFFARVGYVCFLILNWVLLSDLSFRSSLPPLHVFGIGQAASSFGLLLGFLLGSAVQTAGSTLTSHAQELSGALVFVLLVTYIFTFANHDLTRAMGKRGFSADALASDANAPESFERRCLTVAARYHLGERATEVMILFAKGRSKARIEQELYISQSTVSFHLRNVYQKLGVHSRQELIDFLDDPLLVEDSFE